MKIPKISLVILFLLMVILPSCRKSVRKTGHAAVDIASFHTPDETRKKILIFSSSGGGGHTAASQALKEYLEKDYVVEIINVIEEVLYPIDPVRTLTWHTCDGEILYNYFLKNSSKNSARWFANNLCALGKWGVRWQTKKIEPLLEEFLERNRPDALISVIPVLNGSVLHVAERMNIPFAVIPLDRDMSCIGFLNGIYAPTYKKFFYGLPYDDQEMYAATDICKIDREHIRVIGVPVRTTFLQKKNVLGLKEEFGISAHKPVAMVLMGSAGSRASLQYARYLARSKYPLHALICLGKNEGLRTQIARLKLLPHVTFSVIGFTDRIADYMAVSDVLITKPGGLSLFEALTIKVPLLFDRNALAWEKANIQFIEQQGFGQGLRSMKTFSKILEHYITDGTTLQRCKHNIEKYQLPDVVTNIKNLVTEMIR